MKSWQSNISVLLAASVVRIISTLVTQAAWAQTKLENRDQFSQKDVESLNQQLKAQAAPLTTRVKPGKKVQLLQTDGGEQKVRQLSDFRIPITNAIPLLVQTLSQGEKQGSSVIPITSVKANPTDKGVEVILKTTQGTLLQVTNRSTGNNFIVDVSGGQLQLPNGKAFTFRSEKPFAGIIEVTVTNINANTVRVTVVGEKALPTVELYDDNAGLVFAVATTATANSPQQPPQTPQTSQPENQTQPSQPSASGDEPIELVVTGEQDGYRVTDGSTATKIDTPLHDIPQSIQVVPRQVLQDQQVRNLAEALRNVPGVAQGRNSSTRGSANIFTIRGFDAGGDIQRNGLRDSTLIDQTDTADVERIEVLQGPASVLYGQGSLGGVVNYVTKQPLSEPYYAAEVSAGSFNFYRGAIDLSGPLTPNKTVLYRLNVAAQMTESFLDFYDEQKYFVSPVLSWQISDRTKITFSGQYQVRPSKFGQQGLPAEGTLLPNPNGKIPRDLNISEPFSKSDQSALRLGYDLEHRFSDNWQLRNGFAFSSAQRYKVFVYADSLEDNKRILNRGYSGGVNDDRAYNLDTYVVGKFATGSIGHQLVAGFNFIRETSSTTNNNRQIAALDLFNPVYGSQPFGDVDFSGDESSSNTLAIYVQDQVTLAENLKLLLGVRFDTLSQNGKDLVTNTQQTQSSHAFSPRVGLVYQPLQPISLYASYSRSFTPNGGTDYDGNLFDPQYGNSYEVGIKGDINNRLSATLSYYDLTLSNVLTDDPIHIGYVVQNGEQRSKGVELSLAGEILPGWNVIAGYAYTDVEVTKDANPDVVGKSPTNVPKHSFNIWTSYEIQSGALKGFGMGAGVFFIGVRPGDDENTYTVPSYLRTNAAIFYKQDRFRAAINFKNLFNVDYIDSANGSLGVFYADPFAVQGTISWQF
ncbi:TonB-dependent siderophore receptor [Nostoc sp.]|uniref:TonB-dependent siderophore receptor n=1 Tax=Nostoc sp. TaxID=1180 RepID=UPI002FF766B1